MIFFLTFYFILKFSLLIVEVRFLGRRVMCIDFFFNFLFILKFSLLIVVIVSCA